MLHLSIELTGPDPDALAIILETISEAIVQGSRSGDGYEVTGESEPEDPDAWWNDDEEDKQEEPAFDFDDDDDVAWEEEDDEPLEIMTEAGTDAERDGATTGSTVPRCDEPSTQRSRKD